jgi:hypothetical protein
MFDVANNTQFLEAIGIANAPEDVKATLVAGIENLARDRLVIRLSDKLTEEQANQFGNITDEQQAKDWLQANVPDFSQIVTDVFEEIKNEILSHKADVIGG